VRDEEYTGPLAEPLFPVDLIFGHEELGLKVALLFDHFGIDREDKNAWQELAFALMMRHVPGFRLPPVQGREEARGFQDITLIIVVRILMRRPEIKNEADALKKVLESKMLSGNYTYETLRQRLRRAEKRYIAGTDAGMSLIFEAIDQGLGDEFVHTFLS
jgi:hypothetical protein